MRDNNLSSLLTVKDIKTRYRIGNDKAYALMHCKDFPSFVIMGKYYVNANELEKYEKRKMIKIR